MKKFYGLGVLIAGFFLLNGCATSKELEYSTAAKYYLEKNELYEYSYITSDSRVVKKKFDYVDTLMALVCGPLNEDKSLYANIVQIEKVLDKIDEMNDLRKNEIPFQIVVNYAKGKIERKDKYEIVSRIISRGYSIERKYSITYNHLNESLIDGKYKNNEMVSAIDIVVKCNFEKLKEALINGIMQYYYSNPHLDDENGNNIFHLAVKYERDDLSKIPKSTNNINDKNKNGESPLELAVANNNLTMVRKLLDNGSVYVLQDTQKRFNSIEISALLSGSIELFELLIGKKYYDYDYLINLVNEICVELINDSKKIELEIGASKNTLFVLDKQLPLLKAKGDNKYKYGGYNFNSAYGEYNNAVESYKNNKLAILNLSKKFEEKIEKLKLLSEKINPYLNMKMTEQDNSPNLDSGSINKYAGFIENGKIIKARIKENEISIGYADKPLKNFYFYFVDNGKKIPMKLIVNNINYDYGVLLNNENITSITISITNKSIMYTAYSRKNGWTKWIDANNECSFIDKTPIEMFVIREK